MTDILSLASLIDAPSTFVVLTSVAKSTDENVFITRLRKESDAVVDGLDIADTKTLTLFVATKTAQGEGEIITIDPTNWDYTVSQLTPEGSTDVYDIKWLKAK